MVKLTDNHYITEKMSLLTTVCSHKKKQCPGVNDTFREVNAIGFGDCFFI